MLTAALTVSGLFTGGPDFVSADTSDKEDAHHWGYDPALDMDLHDNSGKAFYSDGGVWDLVIYDNEQDSRIWFQNTFDIDVTYSTTDTDIIELKDYRTEYGYDDGVYISIKSTGTALIKIHVPQGQYHNEHDFSVNLTIKNKEQEREELRELYGPKPNTGSDTSGQNTGSTSTSTNEPVPKYGQLIYGVDEMKTVFGKPATLTLYAATNITYSSSNTATATINSDGIINFKRPGTVIITAEAEEDIMYLSTVKHIKITSKIQKPSLKCSARKKHANKLTWSKVPKADGYELYIKYPGSKKYVKALTKKATVKSVTHKGLTSKKKYSYKVRAFVKVNGKKYYSSFSKAITVKVR